MKADEYLVEMLENIKAENEKLKKEIKELKEERYNLLGQRDTLTSGDDTNMTIIEKTGNIFEISYFQDYEIISAINDNKITIRDLGEALLDDNKILQKLEENLGVNKKYYLAHVDPFQYEYLIKFLGRTIAVPRNAFRQSLDCEYSIVHCYNIDNKSYFLDYEQAKKAVIEKARDEIRKALDIFTGVEEQ